MSKKFCPKCKSINVKSELNILLAAGAPQKCICEDCGFNGFMFPEFNKEEIKNK